MIQFNTQLQFKHFDSAATTTVTGGFHSNHSFLHALKKTKVIGVLQMFGQKNRLKVFGVCIYFPTLERSPSQTVASDHSVQREAAQTIFHRPHSVVSCFFERILLLFLPRTAFFEVKPADGAPSTPTYEMRRDPPPLFTSLRPF